MGFLKDFFNKVNFYLDKEIDKANFKSKKYCPKSKIGKILWEIFFPYKNNNYKPKQHNSKNAIAKKIIHVVNFIDPEKISNKNLKNRINLSIESINNNASKNTTILAASECDCIVPDGWKFLKLKRSAKSKLKSNKDFAFLKDMLDGASNLLSDDDIILYTNMDCIISDSIYKDILNDNKDITEFLRRDVTFSKKLDDIYKLNYSIYEIGVDGLSIRNSIYKKIRDKLPDFVIGEPHWDTCYSGILHKHFSVEQNTKDLFHIIHNQEWDDSNLSYAGNYNKKLYLESISCGLMDDVIINIKKQTIFLYLKHSLKNANLTEVRSALKNFGFIKSIDFIFCEFLDESSVPIGPKLGFKYYNIYNKNKFTKALDQKNSISNILLHSFSNYRNIVILYENIKNISSDDIKTIQLSLQSKGKYVDKYIYAVTNKGLIEKELDIYANNLYDSKDIFLNDEGLIELLNNKYEPRNI